jgi:peptidoglycan/LPS O-acetylase OafA/YrhL
MMSAGGPSLERAASPGARSTSEAGRRENIFDFVRLFAAATVIFGHSFTHFNIPVLARWVDGRLEPGMYWFMDGVPLFFILSGHLVFRSCQKCIEQQRPVRSFYWNRALRVVPAIYLYLALVTLWLLVIGVLSIPQLAGREYLGYLARGLVMLPIGSPSIFSHFGIGVLNGSLWTIPVEISFYLFVPLIVFAWNRFGASRTSWGLLGVAMLGLIARWALFASYGHSLPVKLIDLTLVPYLVWFCTGIVAGHYWGRLSHHFGWFILAMIVYFAIRWAGFDYRESHGPLYTFAFALPLAYIVMWLGFQGWHRLGALTKAGDVSYGIYIWHMIVVNSLLYFGVGSALTGMNRLWLPPMVLGVTYFIGLFSWKLVEKRALELKSYSSHPVAK